jgi:hypothetical protein
MAEPDVPEGVTVEQDRDTVSASTVVPAPPAEVFDFIRRPANHPVISGDSTVKGSHSGPELLGEGDRFGMSMKLGVPYRMTSQVKEFTHGTTIAWAHVSGHRWRWQLEPTTGGQTKVTETYDQTTAKVPIALRLLGYPGRHRANVARSVANVRDHFAS